MSAHHARQHNDAGGPPASSTIIDSCPIIIRNHPIIRSPSFFYNRREATDLEDQNMAHINEPIHPSDLGPMAVPWSPLGDGEHQFSYATVKNPWTAELDNATSLTPTAGPLIDFSENDDEVVSILPSKHNDSTLESNLKEAALNRESNKPREISLQLQTHTPTDTHRIFITGNLYKALIHYLDTLPHGLLGTFEIPFDITRTTTWGDFSLAFRQACIQHKLSPSWKKGESLVLSATAKVSRQTSFLHRRVMDTVKIEASGFEKAIRRVVESGTREVRVDCYVKKRTVRFAREPVRVRERGSGGMGRSNGVLGD